MSPLIKNRGRVFAREAVTVTEGQRRLDETQTWLAMQVTGLSLVLRKDAMTGQERILALAEFNAHVRTLWLISTGEKPEGPDFEQFKRYMKDNPA